MNCRLPNIIQISFRCKALKESPVSYHHFAIDTETDEIWIWDSITGQFITPDALEAGTRQKLLASAKKD